MAVGAHKALAQSRLASASEHSQRVEAGALLVLTSTWTMDAGELDSALERLLQLRREKGAAAREISPRVLVMAVVGKTLGAICGWDFFTAKPDLAHPSTPESLAALRNTVRIGIGLLQDDEDDPFMDVGAHAFLGRKQALLQYASPPTGGAPRRPAATLGTPGRTPRYS